MSNMIVKKSRTEGKGVFAVKPFKKGEKILTIDDSHVVADPSKLTSRQHEYDLDYLDKKIVLMQSPEKYINHSCDPTVYVKTVRRVRTLLAMKDIRKGEEIAYDYSINGDNEGTFKCRCGSRRCRGTYQGNFFKLPTDFQCEYMPYLENWFIRKHQSKVTLLKKKCLQ